MKEFLADFAFGLGRIIGSSRLFGHGEREVHVILNPHAGALRKDSGRAAILAEMDVLGAGAEPVPVHIHLTEYSGHGALIAASIVHDSRPAGQPLLIITMGGDGTHNECMTGLIMLSPQDKSRILVFRFPMGTGNDAADAWTIAQALACLREGSQTGPVDAIRLDIPGRMPRWAFNIASCGLDAFVVEMTNRLKSIIPGSFYRLAADVAVLVYTMFMKPATLRFNQKDHHGVFGIVALGVSGFRTYGHGLWVLPGEENLCTIRRGSLLRNIALKTRLYHADHMELPETLAARTTRVELLFKGRAWFQLDGEVLRAESGQGAVVMSLVPTGLLCLSAKEMKRVVIDRDRKSSSQRKS